MPQEFCIYKCYSCSMFQVHIAKKSSNKWHCKMCGDKQSITKVFGQGSAKVCREHVQKFNLMKGVSAESGGHGTGEQDRQNEKRKSDTPADEDDCNHAPKASECDDAPPIKLSKWDCFLSSDSDVE